MASWPTRWGKFLTFGDWASCCIYFLETFLSVQHYPDTNPHRTMRLLIENRPSLLRYGVFFYLLLLTNATIC